MGTYPRTVGRLLLLAIPIAVAVYAFIDVLATPASAIHRGPKWLWALAVLVLPLLGAVLWFVAGRPPRRRRPGRSVSAPDDDPDFLRKLNREIPPREEDPPSAPA